MITALSVGAVAVTMSPRTAPPTGMPPLGPLPTASASFSNGLAETVVPGGDGAGATPMTNAPVEDAAGVFAGIAEPAPAPERTETTNYVVEPGDVLWQIAEKFRLRPETLVWANEIPPTDLILAGQRLVIPPKDGVFYTVQEGERLAEVAQRYGVDPDLVAAANRLTSVDGVQAGADLFLPGARPIRPTTAPSELVQPGSTADGQQLAAGILPPVPLPDNLPELLEAGWVRADAPTTLYKDPSAAKTLHQLPAGTRLERLEGFNQGRIQVRDPGDGTTRQAMTGWVNALDLGVGRAPAAWELPLSYPAATAMDIAQVFAPYRTQLDGSPYAEANCGPATIGMALAAYGVQVSSAQLRTEALAEQRMWGNSIGTLITALSRVVEARGLRTFGLYDSNGDVDRWTTDDIAGQIAAGRVVMAQVRYRSLPGRGGAAYYGDHYILLTGVVPGGFLYNDSINHDGAGWDRLITPERLYSAMNASDSRYAYAAFAVAP